MFLSLVAEKASTIGGRNGKKTPPAKRRRSAGRPGLDPWIGKFPGEGKYKPVQYSCLGDPWTEGLVDCSPQGCKGSDMTQ